MNVCKCGRQFRVHQPGRYRCSTCGTINYFDVDPGEWEAKQQAKRRYSRVADAALRTRRTYATIQLKMRDGEGLGTAIDRLEQAARRFGRNELADRLLEILQICGCDRQVAIATLNAQQVADVEPQPTDG